MPAININYLTDKEGADMATLKAGIQMSREMTSGPAFSKYVEAEYFPGAAFNTDAAVEDYIRKSVHSGNAVVGTCRWASPGCAVLARCRAVCCVLCCGAAQLGLVLAGALVWHVEPA